MRYAALLCLFASLSARAGAPDVPDEVVVAACDVAKKLEQCPSCTCARVTATRPSSGAPGGTIPHALVLRVAAEDHASLYVALGDARKLTHVGQLAQGANVPGSLASTHVVVAQPQFVQTCAGACDFAVYGLIHPFALEATLRLSDADQDTIATDAFAVLCWESTEPMCWSVRVGHESRVEAARKVLSQTHWMRAWSLGDAGDLVLAQPTGELAANAFPPNARRLKLAVLPGSPFAVRVELYRAP